MYQDIQKEIAKIRAKYLQSAEEIVSGYNRECGLSRDYEGRQMFELLQNADDEAIDSFGKVRIAFDGKTLSVSNSGNPFTFPGVKSLLYPNASPKRIHSNKIGCKGLGFRSILTWANSVTIASTEFTIQFSREYAVEFLKSILMDCPSLSDEINKLSPDSYPIATLTCPKILAHHSLVDGYATSIIIDCKDEALSQIDHQIKSLEFEELIFLPNLKEVEIICPDYHKSFFKVSESEEVIIEACDHLNGSSVCSTWMLYKKHGTISDENGNDKEYEFIIAYDPSAKSCGHVLYSYFKTDVKLQFPALIHGTFELTSDRNNLLKGSSINQQLIPLLADFMVDTAVNISSTHSICNYEPLKLVISPDMDLILKETYRLDDLLRDKVKDKKILPTIDNHYISVNDSPKYSASPFDTILKPAFFNTLLKRPDDLTIEDYLRNKLKITFFSYSDFCKQLNCHINKYSISQKADLISYTNKQFRSISSPDLFPHLLVDSDGNSITAPDKVYPLPNEETVIALPDWVKIRFLNAELEAHLYETLQIGKNRRTLAAELSRYNLEEYSFDRLLRGVISQVDAQIDNAERCGDILRWLWNYYISGNNESFAGVNVKVLCRNGEICYANECYLGYEYGNRLGERIISQFSNRFVALDELSLDCHDSAEIAGFLQWLGVSKYPRIATKELIGSEKSLYLDACSPFHCDDGCTYTREKFSRTEHTKVIVTTFEKMDLIIEKAEFNDIIAWLISDPQAQKLIRSETEDTTSKSSIKGIPQGKFNSRSVKPQHMISYFHFYLAQKEWITGIDGTKAPSSRCCFEDIELSPFILVPAIDSDALRSTIGRNCRKESEVLLNHLGVADTFQEMDKSIIYQALMKLPTLDRDCTKGKNLYRKLIRENKTPDTYTEDNPSYDEFIHSGQVPVKCGGIKRYIPVQDAYYADKRVFSNEILKCFNILDIDNRSGEEKVKKLFGVRPLKHIDAEPCGTIQLHPLDEEFKKEYLQFLPFVYACRIGLKNASVDLRKLKSTKLSLCSQISIQYQMDTGTRITTLNDYDPVYLKSKNLAYIKVPQSQTSFTDLKKEFDFADSVAELITTVLDVSDGKEFFRDLFRENNAVREKKMQIDKGDDQLELLKDSRRLFAAETNLRDDFWAAIAESAGKHLTNGTSANEIISQLNLSSDIDADLNYDSINSIENAPLIIQIFQFLGIDLDDFNAITTHHINITTYWIDKVKKKAQIYRPKYLANIYEMLLESDNHTEQYDQYCDDYDFAEYSIENSVYVDIDAVFHDQFGIAFNELDSYKENTIEEILAAARSDIGEEILSVLEASYPKSVIEAHLLFGQIPALMHKKDNLSTQSSPESHVSPNTNIQAMMDHVFSSSPSGLIQVELERSSSKITAGKPTKSGFHIRRVYPEAADKTKQDDGFIGEATVYRELAALYPSTRWISGNAEKAGRIAKGDDTCGYDIRYNDAHGNTQYVEVKASRNNEVVFYMSDNELKFARSHASCYEIIYVVIGDDGHAAHQPWRLGHLFELPTGEDLFNNSKFSISSKEYYINATASNVDITSK